MFLNCTETETLDRVHLMVYESCSDEHMWGLLCYVKSELNVYHPEVLSKVILGY
jgi:hypothetical protein